MIDLEVVDASSPYFIHGQRKLLSTSNSKFGSHEIKIFESIKPNIEFLPATSPPCYLPYPPLLLGFRNLVKEPPKTNFSFHVVHGDRMCFRFPWG